MMLTFCFFCNTSIFSLSGYTATSYCEPHKKLLVKVDCKLKQIGKH